MRFHVCRPSTGGDIESVKDLVLYSSEKIEGCWLYIASNLLSNPNFKIDRFDFYIKEYEIYTDGLTESPRYNSLELKKNEVLKILNK